MKYCALQRVKIKKNVVLVEYFSIANIKNIGFRSFLFFLCFICFRTPTAYVAGTVLAKKTESNLYCMARDFAASVSKDGCQMRM